MQPNCGVKWWRIKLKYISKIELNLGQWYKPTRSASEIRESWIYSGLLRASKSYNRNLGVLKEHFNTRATSHTRLRARDHYTSSTLIGGKGGAGPSSLLHMTLEGPTEYVNGKMDVKSTWMESCMASNGSCFMVTRTIFQKPSFGGRPNTKLVGDHGTMNAHNRWFVLFYRAWEPAWIEIHWNSIWLRARSHMTRHYTWGLVTTLHDFGGVVRRPLDTFFRVVTISWSWTHGSWLVCCGAFILNLF